MAELTLLSCYTSLLLFLAYLALYFMRPKRKEFLCGAAFFLSGSIYLLGLYALELRPTGDACVFWRKLQHAGLFTYVLTFPLLVTAVTYVRLSKALATFLVSLTILMIVLLIGSDLIIQGVGVSIRDGLMRGKEGLLYSPCVVILIGVVAYGSAAMLGAYIRTPRRSLYLLPGIVAISMGVIGALYDLATILQGTSPIPGVRSMFTPGLFLVSWGMAWALLSRFSDALAALLTSQRKLENLRRRLQQDLVEFVEVISKTVEAKDRYTSGHSRRVSWYAERIGHGLGLTEEQVSVLKQACILHDLGKIGIPDDVLNKPGRLDEGEFKEIKKHPIAAKTILQTMGEFHDLLEIVYHHHERWDGDGYPDGLRGEDIPLLARIMAVADTYDALTSNRPYRSAYSKEEAIGILKECKGSQLDSDVVEAFLSVIA